MFYTDINFAYNCNISILLHNVAAFLHALCLNLLFILFEPINYVLCNSLSLVLRN